MPLKKDHGLYGTIMSAMPMEVRREVFSSCNSTGVKKGFFIMRIFGDYRSRRIIDEWFYMTWEKCRSKLNEILNAPNSRIDRAHYDKVVKMMPLKIRREAFIIAVASGQKKIFIIEQLFGGYNSGEIIDAWFRSKWATFMSNHSKQQCR